MKGLICQIQIGNLIFNSVQSCEIVSSWDSITDTATIFLPQEFYKKNELVVKNIQNYLRDNLGKSVSEVRNRMSPEKIANPEGIWKRGDAVHIWFGYSPKMIKVFSGYVSRIYPDSPMKIVCEDAMYLLKKKTVNYSKNVTSAQQLFDDNVSGIKLLPANDFLNYDGIDLTYKVVDTGALGVWRVDNGPVSSIMQKLSTKYGQKCFIRDDVLYCGFGFATKNTSKVIRSINFNNGQKVYQTNTHSKQINHNFFFDGPNNNIISDNLEYRSLDDVNIRIRGTNKSPATGKSVVKQAFYDRENNDEIVVKNISSGETVFGGFQRDFKWNNISDAEFIKQMKIFLQLSAYEGLYGNFVTFGQPDVSHGDTVSLWSIKFPDKNGTYTIKSVIKRFGIDGYTQEIELFSITTSD